MPQYGYGYQYGYQYGSTRHSKGVDPISFSPPPSSSLLPIPSLPPSYTNTSYTNNKTLTPIPSLPPSYTFPLTKHAPSTPLPYFHLNVIP